MDITVYGSGYVGLVVGACLAEVGHHVVCMDVDESKIQALNSGKSPIYEPELEPLIQWNLKAGRLQFTTDPKVAVAHGICQFIAVGTPPDEDGSADLKHVLAVANTIGQHMTDYKIIIDKSTVPIGTADKVYSTVQQALETRQSSAPFDVVSNPEFLKEGAALEDFRKPQRIVIGVDNPRPEKWLKKMYAPFNRNRNRLIFMDTRSAEMTKYAANALLATKISFMNEMANLAEKVDADIEKVRVGIGSDPRIGYDFIYAGCGFGGSCFGKDLKALIQTSKEHHYVPKVIEAVEQVNEVQKNRVFEKISTHFNGELTDKTIALWGLAFKPNTDDMRDAPSQTVIRQLSAKGAKVQAYDPQAMDEAKKCFEIGEQFRVCDTPEEALEGADILVLLTEWRIFRSPDFNQIKERLKQPVIIDGRNVFDPILMQEMGFTYYGIGRKTPAQA